MGGFDFYIDGFVKSVDARVIKERNYNIVLYYSYGSSAVIFPRILGRLWVETVALNAILDPARITRTKEEFDKGVGHLAAISRSLSADFGAMLDTGGEKIFLIDEKGQPSPTRRRCRWSAFSPAARRARGWWESRSPPRGTSRRSRRASGWRWSASRLRCRGR